ncbi:hypothetical protein [Paenibacillus xylanexedens]|uniref:hypothetical protein n=1 Tax=Paenibacillus xylanexedens TaxID=528191 RepID=UPI00119FB633|nr:hypothetical protein [Paenibacillus xylanexedens]
MSVSASIEISLSKQISRMTILRKLEEFGWSYNDQGKVTFLPIGDEDDFNWQRKCIPTDELLKILAIKDNQGELIGVAMTWKDTNIGGTFLIKKNGTILMSPDINRKVLDVESYNKVTDINWYTTKLVPVFGQLFESISYGEHV